MTTRNARRLDSAIRKLNAPDAHDITYRDGGGTFDALTSQPIHPPSGYAVAIAGVNVPADVNASGGIDVGRLGRIVAGEHGAALFGTWVHAGRVYVDAVRIIADKAEAIAYGRERSQLAIYDFATGDLITLEDNAS